MKEKPFFSIITVTLNNLAGLRKTRDSVAAQGFENFEWLVVDGASTDGSQEFLQDCAANFISEPDNGLFDAMNKGIERARGEYMLFLNAGDELAAPDVLEKIALHIQAQPRKPDFVYGDFVEDTGAEKFYKCARPAKALNMGMFTSHQAMFYNRDALGDLRYNLNYRIAADYDFTCRFLQKNSAVSRASVTVCVFEGGGVSTRRAAEGRREENLIRRDLGLCGPLSSIFIAGRQCVTAAFKKAAPRAFITLRNFEARHLTRD